MTHIRTAHFNRSLLRSLAPSRIARLIPAARLIVPLLALVCFLISTGCITSPHILAPELQRTIDRKITEYPTRFQLQPYIDGLDAPTGMSVDEQNNLILAEGGIDGADPHIFGFHPDGTKFTIYPVHTRIPLLKPGFKIYGPIGGVLAYKGHVFVSHRDENDMGVITAFAYDGGHRTLVSNLPAQGDYGVTDIAVSPVDGMLYFGVGAATNSGVVGLDNYDEGWIRKHPDACDLPAQALELLGYRFDAKNPDSSIFSPNQKVTVPFEPFGVSNVTHIPRAPLNKPSGAIYRISPDGGDCVVMGWGVRNPVGLAVNQFNTVYFTDQGMELRGTRPVNNDPDGLFRLVLNTWYGGDDYSRSLEPISATKYQPEIWMIDQTGYPGVRFIIDHQASNLRDPDHRLIAGLFKPLSGASKIAVVPDTGPFRGYEGSMIVALWGDRAPFSTNGVPLKKPLPGYKLVRVDPSSGEVHEFVYNTEGGPASGLTLGRAQAMERPIDVKFGPDGALYILDYGRSRMKGGHEKVTDGTGKVFRLLPIGTTQPAN